MAIVKIQYNSCSIHYICNYHHTPTCYCNCWIHVLPCAGQKTIEITTYTPKNSDDELSDA